MRLSKKKFVFPILGTLFFINILAWIAVFQLNNGGLLEVNFFDVGQGDAIFIETPEGYQILIDGGPSSKILEKLGNEIPFWDRSIDLIISTHPDPDHLLGLIDVLKRYKVGLVGTNGTKSSKPEFKEFENQILKNKVSSKILKKGQRILIGRNLYFDILAPLEDFEGREVSDFNSSSIVTKMVYVSENSTQDSGKTFFFTGDTTKSIEEGLVKEGTNLDSDILKVAHHGSKTANSQIFFEAVSPRIAVIEVGLDNQYGHPNQEVLESLAKYGIRVLRTDLEGDIKIISDGNNFKITK